MPFCETVKIRDRDAVQLWSITVTASSSPFTRVTKRRGVGQEPCDSFLRVEGLPSSGNPTPTEPSVRISRTGLFSDRLTE